MEGKRKYISVGGGEGVGGGALVNLLGRYVCCIFICCEFNGG